MNALPRNLPALLLLAMTLAACGGSGEGGDAPSPNGDAGEAAVVEPLPAVDPAGLEQDVVPEPEAEQPPVPDWQPQLPALTRGDLRTALREAESLEQAGMLVAGGRLPGEPEPAVMLPDTALSERSPGALEIYLAVLAVEPEHPAARQGLERVAALLQARGRAALLAGRLREAEGVERVLARATPQDPALVGFREALEAARRAQAAVRLAEARAKAGRILRPEGAGAVAAYRQALTAFPEYLPALDGLNRLQSDRLNLALEAAQAGDYPASERYLAEAARILPDSAVLQDLSARIVELRQQRAEQLLAQGHAAVDALDLDLAERRLAEAGRASVQAQGLEGLSQRIALARHYGRFRPGEVFREPLASGGEGPEMVVLPHGRFRMGSNQDEPHHQPAEAPAHTIRFARGFAIGRNEVTVAEFRRFVEASGYRSTATRRGRSLVYDERGGVMAEREGVDWRHDYTGRPAAPELPVVHVSFEDAEAYAAWLSAQTGQRYRLPTEAEFEYALRAGSTDPWPWGTGAPARTVGNLTGDGDQSGIGRRWANAITGYSDGHWGPAPVRSYPAEPYGTYDLIGNVSEWVLDCWHDSYRRAPGDGSAWVNPGCEDRVVRGASWASTLERARSAARQAAPAASTNPRVGFRVVREI
ncbi:formylglycine-generating enzyme family protein [Arenimonas fontis]|nr:formylglycine-generating enzyme family protein [Arenimonas fontis]